MRRVVPFFLFIAVVAVGVILRGQETPQQSAAQVKPAAGLEATLFASEPMITNPTDLTVDERGRVWLLEGENYRLKQRGTPDYRPEGDRIVILDDTNHDGKADKITVFDQNPDIRVPLGIAVLGNKVYVSQSPNLIVYTKDDNDKIVKKEVLLTGFNGIDHDHGLHAVVFGWDGKYYFNQGNTGYDVTDKSGHRVYMETPVAAGGGGGGGGRAAGGAGAAAGGAAGRAGGGGFSSNAPPPATPPTGPGYYQGAAFRMNGDGTNLEVIGQNFRNPYEIAVDSWGNVWQTDNDDDGYAWTRLMYNMEGGNYGYRGPLDKTWSEDHGTHWHMEVPGVAPTLFRIGAGAPCGLLVYEGTLLGPMYRGQLFHADAGKRKLAMYPLEERGAGFEARSEDVLNMGDDTWARPVDVAAAPDGGVFVGDWYDPGVGGHLMGDPKGATGRIYRLAPKGNKPVVPKLDLASDAGLTVALASPNQSTQFLVYTAIKAKGPAAVPMLQAVWKQNDPILKARALWLIGGLGAPGAAAIQEAMKSNDPRFRVLGLRVARNTGANTLTFVKPFLHDASPIVRREIALMLQDPSKMLPPFAFTKQEQPSAEWLDAMSTLAMQYDGKDRWYLEAIGIGARGREDALYAKLKQSGGKGAAMGQVVWEMRPKTAVPDLIATINNASATAGDRTVALDTLGNMEWPEAAKAVESFIIATNTPPALAEHAFDVYSHQLFSYWTDSRKSPALAQVMHKAFTLTGAQASAVTLADSLNDPQFAGDMMTLAKSATANADARATAVESLSYAKNAAQLADFEALADAANGPVVVRAAAVRAVANLGQPGTEAWAQKIVLSNAPNEVRSEALKLMGGSAEGLNAMLDLAEKGTLPAELRTQASNLTNNAMPPAPAGRGGRRAAGPASPVTIRQRGGAPTDPAYIAIRDRAAKLLPAPAARKIPSSFEIDLSYGARASEGKKVFDTDAGCAACHSVGGPKKLGPDMSHIGTKYGKQALLDNILDPSAGISPEYVPTTFTMKNGDTVAGLIAEERPDQITVQLGPNQQQRIKPADVASRKEMRVSPMPEGLLNNLSLQQIADLLEYLSTLK